MKKSILRVSFFLTFIVLFGAPSVLAQYWIVGFSQTNVDQPARLIRAKSGTFVDYYIAYDYLPRVYKGEIYRTDDPETTLRAVEGHGYPHQLVVNGIPTSLVGIGFDYTTNNYVPGKTYCTYTTHWVGAYEYYYNGGTYYYDPLQISMFSSTGGGSQFPWTFYNPISYFAVFKWYRLGPTQECKVVPYDPPVIVSITPNGGQEGTIVPIVITGTNFISPQVSISGTGVTAAIVNATPNTIAATLTIAPGTELTDRQVRVTASGGISNYYNFKVGDHTPSAQPIAPPEGTMGTTVPVTIDGSYFGTNPELVVEGAGLTANIISSTSSQIQANFIIDANTTEGNRVIKVRSKGRSGDGFIMTPGASETSNNLNFNVKRRANPTLTIEEVGFDGDYEIRRYPGYLGAPPTNELIAEVTWVRNSSTNANNPVAFPKNALPSSIGLKGKFSVSPTPEPGQNLNIKVRVRRSGTVIATSTGSVPVAGDSVNFGSLNLSGALETAGLVKKATYNFDWEVSFDDGTNWVSAGTSQGHPVYWTFGAPEGLVCFVPRPWECTFPVAQGRAGAPALYDLALEKAITPLTEHTQTAELIAQTLATIVDVEFAYAPNFGRPDGFHPLEMYMRYNNSTADDNFSKAQCSANANLVTGLLRSIGVPTQTVYIWGGQSATETEFGAPRYMYRYRPNAVDDSSQTFKVKRPLSSERGFVVPTDPHFTFHALVRVNGRYFDPSYEAKLAVGLGTTLSLMEVVDLTNPATPIFKDGAATAPYITKALSMRDASANTIPTNDYCPHSWRRASLPHSFDSDRRADIAVWRPSNNFWYIINSSDETFYFRDFGVSGDLITPGDYDGDGITDISVYRPSNNTWYRLETLVPAFITEVFGDAGATPVSGDFDGDGKTDLAYHKITLDGTSKPSVLRIKQSSDGVIKTIVNGTTQAKPVSGDFDGDGKSDPAVVNGGSEWSLILSSNNERRKINWGLPLDVPVPADYDGDGKTDIAIFRPSTATWWMIKSSDGSFYASQFGTSDSVAIPGDYDGDGKADIAVFMNGVWAILQSSNGVDRYYNWGLAGDIPIPAAFR